MNYSKNVLFVFYCLLFAATNMSAMEFPELLEFVKQGEIEHIKKYVRKGNVNTFFEEKKTTLLHVASHSGQLDIVDYLLRLGAKVNPNCFVLEYRYATDGDERVELPNPLHYAALCPNNGSVISLLILHGASMCSTHNNCLYTPLHNAVRKGIAENVRVLCEEGAKLNQQRNNNQQPLFDIDQLDWQERSPIFLVANITDEVAALEIFRILMDHGASIDKKDKEEKTVFDLLKTSGHKGAIEKFEKINQSFKACEVCGQLIKEQFKRLLLFSHFWKKSVD